MAKLLLIAVIAAAVVITCQCDAAAAPPQHTRILETVGVRFPIRATNSKQQPAQQGMHRKLLATLRTDWLTY